MVFVDEHCSGAALWAPPDTWRAKPADLAREMPNAVRLFGRNLPRALRTLSFVEKAHPKTPHNYLAVLGTDPDHQGKGIGSALVAHVTDQADSVGLPCYLESSKESNLPFYASPRLRGDRGARHSGQRSDGLGHVARTPLTSRMCCVNGPVLDRLHTKFVLGTRRLP